MTMLPSETEERRTWLTSDREIPNAIERSAVDSAWDSLLATSTITSFPFRLRYLRQGNESTGTLEVHRRLQLVFV